jgi:glycosyltransferase involved in cell wall biosynthesis
VADVLGSVLIPAHNEAAVIRRCLDALLAEFQPGELEIVVACNGCTDETADVVRATGYLVQIIEIDQASKVAALRVGDTALTAFPRIYLDADVILPATALRLVLQRLTTGPALAARPPLRYETSRSSPLVRAFYRARVRVPGLLTALWGAGVYALAETGRLRFAEYPDAMGDDLFVDQFFARSEIEIVDSCPVTVVVPSHVRDLLAMLRRVYRGNAENRTFAHDKERTTTSTTKELVRGVLSHPQYIPDCAIYIGLVGIARLMAKFSTGGGWERDNSSRSTLLSG